MEFKGTKGFWRIGILGSVQNERGEFICESERNNGSEEENKANNMLISCAPELLECISGLVSDVQNLIQEHDIEWQQAGYYNHAIELIKKATTI